jgi:hypothetical protein
MPYVLVNVKTGAYVAPVEWHKAYTMTQEYARRFATLEEAEQESYNCERAVKVDE